MKKIYLLVSTVLLGSTSFGQVNQTFMNDVKLSRLSKNTKFTEKDKSNTQSVEKTAGDIIFSETFTGSIGAWTTSGTNASVWAYDTDGPGGDFSNPSEIIVSPTSSTGFMIFDGDLFNANGGSANLTGNLISPVIDLTSVPGATLAFYSSYRSCCSNDFYPKIEVSTDGFVSNIVEFDVTVDGIAVNDASGDVLTTVNLSPYLATATNKNNFQFRFVWTGASHYFWQVDDIAIVESSDRDIQLAKFWLNDISTGYEHTDIPTNLAETLTVQAVIKNNGYQPIPASTQVVVTVYNASGVQVATETGGTLSNSLQMLADTITFASSIDLSALAVGTYSVMADLLMTETDNDLTNDSLRRTLNITDFYLGQRNYEKLRSIESIGKLAGTSSTNSQYMTVGNVMRIPSSIASIELHGLELTLGRNATYPITTDTEIEVRLYQVDNGASTTEAMFGDPIETRFFNITSAMIPSSNNLGNVLLNFHESTSAAGSMMLDGGMDYYIAIYHGGGTEHFAYGTNATDDDYSSWIHGPFGTGSTVSWFVNGTQVLSRMCFDPQLEIDASVETISSNGLTFGNLYPNPTTNQTNFHFNLQNESNVSVEVKDVTGKTVYTNNLGSINAGNHKQIIHTESFTSGVYYVTVSTNDSKVTKKLIKK